MHHFREELDSLRSNLVAMAAAAEVAISRSIRGLVYRDEVLAQKVFSEEHELNRMEMQLDADATRLLALYQPMARDLRFLTAALKIDTDLERIGDLAVNIAEHSVALLAYSPVPIPDAITTMGDLAQSMVRSSVESFVDGHAGVARRVLMSDDAVDALKKNVVADLIQLMRRESSIVPQAVAFLLVAHNLERIADHATNIAEDVVFMVEGIDVRHHTDAIR